MKNGLIQPLALPAAFVIAVISFCCRVDNAFILFFDMYEVLPVLLGSFGAGAGICSIVLLCFPFDFHKMRFLATLGFTFMCLLGMVVAGLSSMLDPGYCAVGVGFFTGLGSVGLVGLWAFVFGDMDDSHMIPTMAAVFLIAALLWLALERLNGFAVSVIGLTIFAFCGGAALIMVLQHISRPITVDAQIEEDEQFGPALPEPGFSDEVQPALIEYIDAQTESAAHLSVRKLAESCGALFVAAFLLGELFWMDTPGIGLLAALAKPLSYLAVLVLGYALVIFARGALRSRFTLGQMIRALICVFAVLTITVSQPDMFVWGAEFDMREGVRDFLIAALLVFGICMALSELKKRFNPVRSAAIIMLVMGAAMGLGIAVFVYVPAMASMVLTLVAGLYLALMLAWAFLARQGRAES